ncbi:YhgE/Pip domain-containing protein [Corynebacterium aquatimens]|uniref:Membrane protein n=1 Tax=Corynebacterium aquatimens TaxID=1190508 RepID=A0A931GSW3_9CORY|nr:YhgE/Pip domain-containing protein [Corynebacterium aquatimens]MBG6121260.1 putative membrane protein [Corynebacterium aquatimens]
MSTSISANDYDPEYQYDYADDQTKPRFHGPIAKALNWRPLSPFARTLIVLLLVLPLLFTGIYMWSMWDPTGSVPNTRLAIVNEDKGVDQGEGEENFGKNVVEGLTSRDYLNVTEVDAKQASDGLLKGKYLFTITIPEDFSKNVVTVIDEDPAQAKILFDFNDYNGTNGAILTSGLVPQIQNEVAVEVTKTYAEQVLGGLNELGDGIKQAADGSKQLDDGVGQLQEGAGQAVDGINQLDDGAGELNDGTGQLQDGVIRLSDGAGQLDDGAGQLANGLLELSGGTDQLADGARQIDEGVGQLTGMLIPILQNVQGAVGQLQPVIDLLRTVGMHAEADKVAGIVGQLDPANPENIVSDLQRLKAGTAELHANLADPNMPYRNGLNQLIDGSQQLKAGTGELRAGTGELSDGAFQLHDGTTRLKEGTGQLREGGVQLTDGIGQLKDGSNQLATALGEGAKRAPTVQRMDESTTQMAVPIVFEEANLHPTQEVVDPENPTVQELSSGFSMLGLIVISFLLMAVVNMLLPHAVGRRDHSRTAFGPVIKAWAPAFGINLALVALIAFISASVGWRPDNWPAMILVLLLNVAMGTSVYQFFRITFGRLVGSVFNLAFYIYGLVVANAVWPLSTLPAPLAAANPLHPISHARNAFVRATDGIWDHTFWIAIAVLVATTALALIGSTLVYDARRRNLALEDPNENARLRAERAAEQRALANNQYEEHYV